MKPKCFIACTDTTDEENMSAKVFTEGNYAHIAAISCAIPPLIESQQYQGRYYIDGGYSTALGVDYIRDHIPDSYILGILTEGYLNIKTGIHAVDDVIKAFRGVYIERMELEIENAPPDMLIKLSDEGIEAGLGDFTEVDNLFSAGYKKGKELASQIDSSISE
jgi:predicted acylesterase/phospholipase RssA